MARSPVTVAIIILSIILPCILASGTRPQTRALIAPINVDQSTSLYTFLANDGRSFVIDLSGRILWQSCPKSHPTFSCKSSECSALSDPSFRLSCHPPRFKKCTRGACTIPLKNFIGQNCTTADLTQTTLTLNSTNGRNPTKSVSIPRLASACAPPSFIATLPSHAQGVAPLGPTEFTLPALFASSVPGLKKKFAICLPSGGGRGLLFFGDGPVVLLSGTPVEITSRLDYTPLVKKPDHPLDHFIPLNAIAVGLRKLNHPPVRGGAAKLSTTIPYTLLSTPIYKALIEAFNTGTSGVPRVKTVKPFEICLNATALGYTRIGPPVPQIDLTMNGKNWTIFGANSMMEINENTTCLAFLDGGYKAEFDVVIGAYQMQNNFLQFDLEESRLGYSSILYGIMTTCSNFNFTSSA